MRVYLFYKVSVTVIWNPDKDNTDHLTSVDPFVTFTNTLLTQVLSQPIYSNELYYLFIILFTSKPKHDLRTDAHSLLSIFSSKM